MFLRKVRNCGVQFWVPVLPLDTFQSNTELSPEKLAFQFTIDFCIIIFLTCIPYYPNILRRHQSSFSRQENANAWLFSKCLCVAILKSKMNSLDSIIHPLSKKINDAYSVSAINKHYCCVSSGWLTVVSRL